MAEYTPETLIYKNPNLPIESRIQDLISRMTLQEKIGQMTQIERQVVSPFALKTLSIGSVLSAGGSVPFENALTGDWTNMVDRFQKMALESRLGIPLIYGIDAVHGNNNVYGATVFPHNVGLGATRDVDLVRRIGEATALEVRASGIHYTFAPCVAVTRDPRWGRCYESFSEDPDIVRKLTSVVSGLQGDPPEGHPYGHPFVAGSKNVIACAKHFVGDGGTEKGVNEGNTIATYEELEKIHMAPYIDCIAQGVSTIMATYSSWNGDNLHSHRYLLTDILKGKLGFKGFVISDWEGLDRLSKPHGSNYRSCVLSAVNAGIDMVMVPFKYEQFIEDMLYLVESGNIPMTRIDDAVERILRVKFAARLFEHPMTDRSLIDIVGCKLHRDLGREAVRKSMVLLKNGKDPEKPFLPLDKNPKRILVVGSHADNLGYQCGGWTITWYGLSGRITVGTTILEAVKKALGDEVEVVYKENPSAEYLSGVVPLAVASVWPLAGCLPLKSSLPPHGRCADCVVGGLRSDCVSELLGSRGRGCWVVVVSTDLVAGGAIDWRVADGGLLGGGLGDGGLAGQLVDVGGLRVVMALVDVSGGRFEQVGDCATQWPFWSLYCHSRGDLLVALYSFSFF